MRNTISQALKTIKEDFKDDNVFINAKRFRAVLSDVRIETDEKKVRHLLNVAVREMQVYSRLKAELNNNVFIIDNLTAEMSSDYMIEKDVAQIVIECFAELLGYVQVKPQNIVSKKENQLLNNSEISIYGNTTGNIKNCGMVAHSGEYVYYTNSNDDSKLYKAHTSGTESQKLCDDSVSQINVVGDWIYYANLNEDSNEDGRIYKIRTNGTGRVKVCDDAVRSMNVVGDWIYYCNDEGDSKLYKIRTDGAEKQKLTDDKTYSLNVIDDWCFYNNKSDEGKLYKIRTNGTERTKLSDDNAVSLCVVGSYIYYSKRGADYSIHKIKTDGTDYAVLPTKPYCFYFNVTDNEWIYYKGDHLYKIRTDGSQCKMLKTIDENLFDDGSLISVIKDWIYLLEDGEGKDNYKIRTDGTEWQKVDFDYFYCENEQKESSDEIFSDSPAAEIQTALELYAQGDYEGTYKIVSKLANDKVPRAINLLGMLHQHGQYVEQNIDKSSELYRQAGELGEPRGYVNLANNLVNNHSGEWLENEKDEVRNLVIKAAAMPGAYGKQNYGWALQFGGYYFEQDIKEAVKQYELAACELSKYYLGLILCFGEGGITKDDKRGVMLLQQAAQQAAEGVYRFHKAFEMIFLTSNCYEEVLNKAESISSGSKVFSPSDARFQNFAVGTEPQQNAEIEKVAYSAVFGTEKNHTLSGLAAWQLLTSLFQYLWYEAPQKEQNLFMIKELLDAGIKVGFDKRTDLDRLFALCEEKKPEHISIKTYAAYKTLSKHNAANVAKEVSALFNYIGKPDNMFMQVQKNNIDEASKKLATVICTTWAHTNSERNNEIYIEKNISELYAIIKNIAEKKRNYNQRFNIFELKKAVSKNEDFDFRINLMIKFFTEHRGTDSEIFEKYIEAGLPVSGLTDEQLKTSLENFKIAQKQATS